MIAGIEKVDAWQARLTFAMLRHCVVDLIQVLNCRPESQKSVCLSAADRDALYAYLRKPALLCPHAGSGSEAAEAEVHVLSYRSSLQSPCASHAGITQTDRVKDNWKTGAFERAEALTDLPSARVDAGQDGH